MRSRTAPSVPAVMLVSLALLVAACDAAEQAGPTETPPETAAETEPPAETDAGYNDADIAFLEGMIAHHAQAVAMAEVVPDHTDRAELVAFAEDIIEMQQAEITQMRTMLEEAGATDGHGGGMDHTEDSAGMDDMADDMGGTADGDGMDGMPERDGMEGMEGTEGTEGMMSEEQMSALQGLQGQEFDLRFIDLMIEHHQGAIDASERVLQEGEHPEVRALAEGIIAAQQDEIEQMTAWREQWSSGA